MVKLSNNNIPRYTYTIIDWSCMGRNEMNKMILMIIWDGFDGVQIHVIETFVRFVSEIYHCKHIDIDPGNKDKYKKKHGYL